MDEKELTVAENLSSVSLDSEKTIEKLTAEIQYYLVQMGQNAIEIGKRLILAKAKLSHGKWQNWLEDNFNLSYRTAAKFMAIAERFSKVPTSALFSQSQMFEMLSLPESETKKFIEVRALEGTPVDSMSIKKLREEIKKYKSDLAAEPTKKSGEVEVSDNVEKLQSSAILSEDAVTAVAVEEKIELADSALEIPNEVEEKVEEISSERLENSETSQNLNQSQIDISNNLAEKEEVYKGVQDLEKFFKYLPLLLNNVNLQKVVEICAEKDLKELEKQLGQLSAVHTELKNCLAVWKKQPPENMSRKAIISVLQQIALADNPPFKKSKFIRDSVEALGCKSVHNVPTKELNRILNEVSKLKN